MKVLSLRPVMLAHAAAAVLFAIGTNHVFGQGSLTPPGTPAPTMKTLDQVQPRTPIGSLPYTISASGSYYFTGNLTATGSNAGITVSADNVTIDLNGFALVGGGGSGVNGINVPAARQNLVVRNGSINAWGGAGINAALAPSAVFEKLLIANNGGAGLITGANASIIACETNDNSGDGFYTSTSCLVSQCKVAYDGISVGDNSTVLNCQSTSFIGITAGNGCTISNCTAVGYSACIHTGNNCNITHCTALSSEGGNGIQTGDGCTLADDTAGSNAENGILVGNGCMIHGCTVRANGFNGITAAAGNKIIGNTVDANNTNNNGSYAGVSITSYGNTIDGNSITANAVLSMKVSSAGNIIIRNTFTGNAPSIAAGNTVGPTVDSTAASHASTPTTTTISSTSPWANFVFY